MIGRIAYTSPHEPGEQWLELADDGKLTGSDPPAVMHFRDVLTDREWSPADGPFGLMFLVETTTELNGKLTLEKKPDGPPGRVY